MKKKEPTIHEHNDFLVPGDSSPDDKAGIKRTFTRTHSQEWQQNITIELKDPNFASIFIVKKIDNDKVTKHTINIIKKLLTYQVKLYVEENCLEEIKLVSENDHLSDSLIPFQEKDEMNIDLLIVIGGDGTILWALQYFTKRITPPVLAFSSGTLGYLCNFSLKSYDLELKRIMDSILEHKPLNIEKRNRIRCEIRNKSTGKKKVIQALNEVVIDRGCNPNIIKVDCYLEGKLLGAFDGDGVLISTPTGSTAYQLSAGGPIVNHLLDSMCITPLNSVQIATKPLVISSDLRLTFKLNPASRKHGFISADGQMKVEMGPDVEAELTGSDLYVPWIVLLGEDQDTLDNWIIRLKKLLGWNQPKTLDEDE